MLKNCNQMLARLMRTSRRQPLECESDYQLSFFLINHGYQYQKTRHLYYPEQPSTNNKKLAQLQNKFAKIYHIFGTPLFRTENQSFTWLITVENIYTNISER